MTTEFFALIIAAVCIAIGVSGGIYVASRQRKAAEKAALQSQIFEIDWATFRTPCRYRLPKYDSEHMTALICQCLETNKSCIKEFCPFLNKRGE